MKQIELYVPKTDNDGLPIPVRSWEEVKSLLLHYFDGFTVYTATGQWISNSSKVLTDSIVIYRILCQDDRAYQIVSLAEFVKRHWRQESVLYTVADIDAHYV